MDLREIYRLREGKLNVEMLLYTTLQNAKRSGDGNLGAALAHHHEARRKAAFVTIMHAVATPRSATTSLRS
jgi:hypothetical protein